MKAPRYLETAVTLQYDSDKCNGCRRCVEVCPHAVFRMADKRAVLADRGACMECGACAGNCEQGAIAVQSGVGCAAGVIIGWLQGTGPTCGCDEGTGGCC